MSLGHETGCAFKLRTIELSQGEFCFKAGLVWRRSNCRFVFLGEILDPAESCVATMLVQKEKFLMWVIEVVVLGG